MTTFTAIWRRALGRETVETEAQELTGAGPAAERVQPQLDIAPNDPLLTYLQNSSGVVEVENLPFDSPAVGALRAAGISLVVPLVSQGELIGIINLGSRLSEQAYSSDDRKLLSDLATQAAPALRVAQLVEQQKVEAAERERIEQELRVASLIQHTLLPKEVPQLAGWALTAYYQPARQVGGDFYDFVEFPDGRLAFIVADVTDKGVPAALVMATTRSILRSAAESLVDPGQVLERTNDVLYPQIPPKMFVTCFYALLDPATGYVRFANAGHDVPYRYTPDGVVELRATGMPLGLMPGMQYEEKETTLAPGDHVLVYSDGLVEAHNPDREMFGFPRLQELMAGYADGASLNDFLLAQLADFTGPGWEQEDDVTLVTVQYAAPDDEAWQPLAAFSIDSVQGNERQAMARVAEALAGLPLDDYRVERLKTAVAEATMNAMEHGNRYDPKRPVFIVVDRGETAVRVAISDQGGGRPIAADENMPDLEAKLAGEQTPRGWGLFLIENMVDDVIISQDDHQHTVTLIQSYSAEDGEKR
ncbi:MAG: SpoIIE family protein phosphatase [Candidatus Promineifilaceae bacterium]